MSEIQDSPTPSPQLELDEPPPLPHPSTQRNNKKASDSPPNIFGIPHYQSSYSGGRSYNYEEKYAPDALGEETSENARVWKVYLDEAENYDDEMLRGFRDTIDSLLVFAALFSGVVTSFIIATIDSLQPDYPAITALLLMEQVQLLRAAGNLTTINAIPKSNVDLQNASPSSRDLWVNGLLLASLSFALATALLSVLVKQWLQAYSAMSFGNAQEKTLICQFRFPLAEGIPCIIM